ncbi:MAG: J domain-containing protein [Candidatus Caldarchaeum sp.]|nr:J domain-containing protein [Candidatus Caldarchaeum sp.]
MTVAVLFAFIIGGLTAFLILYSLRNFTSESKRRNDWPFSVLGVSPSDPLDVVKKTYRELVKRYHPDRLPHNASPQVKKLYEERLIRLNNAYKTILSLHETSSVQLAVSRADFGEVEKILQRAEDSARRAEKASAIVGHVYEAVEQLVRTLHRSAGLVGRSEHFYDLLTDLMINDVLTVEEFEVLAEPRRLMNLKEHQISFKEAVILNRRVSGVYLKIRDRYCIEGNG